MLKDQYVPTPLIDPSEREGVVIVPLRQLQGRSRRLRIVVGFLHLLAVMMWLLIRGKLTRAERAARIRGFFERIGGLWIKLGQLVSLRRDLFSPEFCDEMAHLHYEAFGFEPEVGVQLIEQELGRPIDEVFEDFDPVPFAAASIGQVYRARLRSNGARVALKVQRPYIARAFRRDLSLIRLIANLCHHLSILPHMHWKELIWETYQMMDEEIDYRVEASAMVRMKKSLRAHPVHVPRVFLDLCTPRLLVTEFVPGVLLSDCLKVHRRDPQRLAAWCAENDISPRQVALRIFDSHLRQLFEDNLFHGDLHAGNIFLLRHGHIAFIDISPVGSMEGEFQRRYRIFFQSLAEREYARATDALILITGTLPPIDLEAIRERMIQQLTAWETRNHTKGMPFRPKSIARLMEDVLKVLLEFRITMRWSLVRWDRTNISLDAALGELFPEANYPMLFRHYFRRSDRRGARVPGAGAAEGGRSTVEGDTGLRALVGAVFEEAALRRHAFQFYGLTKLDALLAHAFGTLTLVLAGLGLFLLLAFLRQHREGEFARIVGDRWSTAFDAIPRLDSLAWVLILLATLYCWSTALRIKRLFGRNSLSTGLYKV